MQKFLLLPALLAIFAAGCSDMDEPVEIDRSRTGEMWKPLTDDLNAAKDASQIFQQAQDHHLKALEHQTEQE